MYVYGDKASYLDYNNNQKRNSKETRNKGLIGFKIKCSGRFSRRQRSRGI